MSFKKIVEAGAATILFLTPVKSSINSVVAAEGSKSQSVACQRFFDVANISYTPVIWDPVHKAYESGFVQKSKPGELGYVEDVSMGGSMYEQGKAGPIIVFPVGARVTGYDVETKYKKIKLPDGTELDSYDTCYRRK